MMKKVYVVLFAILYLIVSITSTIHAFEFFGLANGNIMAIMLACAFEIGQAAVLFSLLTSPKERSKIMPWVLMCILTLVQILGNIYSSYKYLMINSADNLQYFKEPIFVWTNLPDNQATVIVTYLVGAILPIVSLLLTSMVTNQLDPENKTIDEIAKEQEVEKKEENIEQENKKEIKEEENNSEEQIEDKEIEEDKSKEISNDIKEDEQPISQDVEDLLGEEIIPQSNYPKSKSKFINI